MLPKVSRPFFCLRSLCTKKDYDTEFRNQNKEALKERAKQKSLLNDKDVIKTKQQDYISLNKEARAVKLRNYYLENHAKLKGKSKESSKEYYWKNRDEVNRKTRKRYVARRANARTIYAPRLHPVHKSWRTPSAIKEYFDTLGPQLHISHPTEWYRVSRAQIIKAGGSQCVVLD